MLGCIIASINSQKLKKSPGTGATLISLSDLSFIPFAFLVHWNDGFKAIAFWFQQTKSRAAEASLFS
jgi:hypothetical protein